MSLSPPLLSGQNFFDPTLTSSGESYGPTRLKEIVKERYIITKHTNTSYTDTGEITPYERGLLIDFIIEDLKEEKKSIEENLKRKNE